MPNKFPRGSEWRKWDLHIHTPKSICQNYGGENNWEKFILALERLPKDVKVIGITDYYFIDGFEKVMEYRNADRLQNLEKIFPILEFRIDTFGSSSENKLNKINLHILFDIDELDISNEVTKVKSEFIAQIPISNLPQHQTKMLSIKNLIDAGGNDLKKGFESLVPSTEKVFELIQSSTWANKTFLFLGYKEWSNLDKNNQLKPLKENMYSKVQAFFSSNPKTNGQNQKWLNEFGEKRLLHSGDFHSFEALDTANKDVENNYIESAKYVCETWIKAAPTFEGLKQIICEPEERVRIQANKPGEKSGYQVIESVAIKSKYCKQNILLNSNLNSIIGGRSTGKSTLLKLIAHSIDPKVGIEETHIKEISEKYTSVMWQDGEENKGRDIEFFPQSYMYNIARNIEEKDALIEGIVKEKDTNLLLRDYEIFCRLNISTIQTNIDNLFELQNKQNGYIIQLKEKGDKEGLEKEIKSIQSKIKEVHNDDFSEDDLNQYEKTKDTLLEKEQKLKQAQKDKGEIELLKEEDLFNQSFIYKLNDLSDTSNKEIQKIYEGIKESATISWKLKLTEKINTLNETKKELKEEIHTIRKTAVYKKGEQQREINKQYSELSERLKIEQKKLEEIVRIQKQIALLDNQKEKLISQAVESHYAFTERIDRLIEEFDLQHDDILVEIEKVFKKDKCGSLFHDFINLQSNVNKALVDDWVNGYGTDTLQKVRSFLISALEDSVTLKAYKDMKDFTKGLLTANWFSISYKLTYQGDTFEKMSDGKKAFVVLKLLLEFSDKECPILLDQPEDSLDNRAIYNELVVYLKQKKKSRQIILVTHNANIVVNADAEEVIVSNQHGDNSKNHNGVKFQYISGSIENTMPKNDRLDIVLESQGIREHACEILEGGTDAFKKRENKYAIG